MADEDLWQRIMQQNAEKTAENAERAAAQARLAEHEQYAQAEQKWQQTSYQPQQSVGLSAAALDEREREIDRQLELERSLQRGASQDQRGRGGPGGGMLQQQRSGGKLTHANAGAKENRGKISLLPMRGGAPPSSCGASEAGGKRRPPPSTAGSIPPSVAGSIAPSLRQPKPVHYSHMMDRPSGQVSQGHQMDGILNPADGIRGQMRRAGVEPKDHLRENRQMLREISEVKAQKKQMDAAAEEEKRQTEARIRDRSRARAQQTLAGLGALDISEDDGYGAPPTRGASAGRRSTRPPPTGQEPPPPSARPHAPGTVPAYLQRRKAEWQATADEARARAEAEAACPPGTRLVGPEEKSRILEKLAEERAKAAVALRELPFVIKTTATQQKKDQLEARLEEIAGAEEAYSREKVFVPADM